MANRHAHKKLRAEVLARMQATGDGYQRALAHVLSSRSATRDPRTDLVSFSYFGVPATLATIEMNGVAFAVMLPSSRLWGKGYPQPFPVPLVRAFMRTRGVQ